MRTPLVATYRVQFQPGFGFDDAVGIIDYLAELGVSHLYCSPVLQAATGSTHGYDVVDPTRVSADLGGEEGFARLCEALHRAGMGLVLDIVPNHMAICGRENAWWWEVLENGPASPYASHFDVDWDPPEARLRNRILVPILGDRYGRVLEAREIKLVRKGGTFALRYHEHELPAAPRSLESLLTATCDSVDCDELAFLAGAFGRLPMATQTDSASVQRRHRDKAVLRDMLERLLGARRDVAAAIDRVVSEWNDSPEAMDVFLRLQNYRLAYWRNAERELGYRRFFDINSLAALRVENEKVFADTHNLVLQWVREGIVDGLRVDHVDGLRDPAAYLRRLRDAAPRTWIIVEKILQPGESLPLNWPVAGTTGYDFLNLVGGLFLHPNGEQTITDFWVEFTGDRHDFSEVVHECKKAVLSTSLCADVNRLTVLLLKISAARPVSQDFTRHELKELLCEVLAGFPVYRTYLGAEASGPSETDAAHIAHAVSSARRRRPDLDPGLFCFLQDLFQMRLSGQREAEFVQRFQQLSATVMAKGVEDTAFYRFTRFIGLNEVGGGPDRFGTRVEQFHETCAAVQRQWPQTMVTTSTHDTKRSEDVRARLALLSEIPDAWCAAVTRWSRRNARYKTGAFPDRSAEFLLYQTLVGAWPISVPRVTEYATKAAREARQYTSWTHENAEYEEALLKFIKATLEDQEFLGDLKAFVQPLILSGRINSLGQTLLKLTAPGIPDIYQGTELWDLSLVDPDNRRPVDYGRRRNLRNEARNDMFTVSAITGEEGAVKLRLISRTLALRRQFPKAFGSDGAFRPLPVTGSRRNHVVAFVRGETCAVIVPRWLLSLGDDWADTSIELPPGRWRNEFTGGELHGGSSRLNELLVRFPEALLVRSG